jgi:hypothetical protein
MSSRSWPHRQEVAVETFVEVLEAKKAVFDKWEVDSFDEVRPDLQPLSL